MNDIKRACPSVQTIVHSKWLMINGSMEEIQKEKDGILATACIGITCLLQRVQMYGFNSTGKKVQTCFGIIVCCTCFLTTMESN